MPDEATKPEADATPAEKPRRSWFKREPLDEAGQRTMYLGLFIAFALYVVGIIIPIAWRGRSWTTVASFIATIASVVFLGAWFLAVRGGFRIGKAKSRSQRRAAMHAKEEREKRIRLNR